MQGIRDARGGAGNGSGTGQSGTQGISSPFKQDFTALANALSSGDLQGAQKAFASLQQDMQSIRQGHHHHHNGGNPLPASADAGSASQTLGVGIDVTA